MPVLPTTRKLIQVTHVKKVIVVCPTSLVNNWAEEFQKWLQSRVKYVACNGTSQADKLKQIAAFNMKNGAHKKTVLIISYESLRLYISKLIGQGKCDLLVCDEAHRLKNDQTLVNQALDSLDCDARVLLSGTPLQDDLDELYFMSAFTQRYTCYDTKEQKEEREKLVKKFEMELVKSKSDGGHPLSTMSVNSQDIDSANRGTKRKSVMSTTSQSSINSSISNSNKSSKSSKSSKSKSRNYHHRLQYRKNHTTTHHHHQHHLHHQQSTLLPPNHLPLRMNKGNVWHETKLKL